MHVVGPDRKVPFSKEFPASGAECGAYRGSVRKIRVERASKIACKFVGYLCERPDVVRDSFPEESETEIAHILLCGNGRNVRRVAGVRENQEGKCSPRGDTNNVVAGKQVSVCTPPSSLVSFTFSIFPMPYKVKNLVLKLKMAAKLFDAQT